MRALARSSSINCFPIFLHENIFTKSCEKRDQGLILAETNDYDKIFTALKHPIRRQILLLLEKKGEVSFTEIQKAVNIDDTGLLSYHLKELTTLVEQSERGKYALSEIGRASMALFRKVEREKQTTTVSVHRELEKITGEIVFLILIVAVATSASLSADIYLQVQTIYGSLPIELILSIFAASLLGMIVSVILFVFYDRHYFIRTAKTTTMHSTVFAIGVSLLSILSAYNTYYFQQQALSIGNGTSLLANNSIWLLSIVRTIAFLAITPVIALETSKLLSRR